MADLRVSATLVSLFEGIPSGCPDGWELLGQYCMHFAGFTALWDDAQVFCSSIGAFLVDDLNSDKDSFLAREFFGRH